MTGHAFALDPDDAEGRTVHGTLLPFGEESRLSITGAEPITFDGPDNVTVPADPSVITLHDEHDQYAPLGRATLAEPRPDGVYVKFAIARTPEGDAYLADIASGKRSGALSPEVARLIRAGAKAVSGLITGAGAVGQGAFAGAHLFAIGAVTDTTTNPSPSPTKEPIMTSIVPGGAAAPEAPRPATLNAMFAAIQRNDPDALQPFARAGEAFALGTIQNDGPAGRTIGADTAETGYLGELWSRRAYQRRYVPLVTSRSLTNWTMQGWRFLTEPVVADYAGNTAEVPSNVVDTEPVTLTAARLASGHRLDRRFEDFNDQSVISSFMDKQSESYARVSDGKCLSGMVAAATATAPGAVPAGVAKGLAAIVDGALGVIDTENRPAFAIVSPELWRDIVLMKDDDKLGFLNAGFGLEEGDLDGFKIVPGAVGAGKVLVGAREAYEFYELPGVPIRVSGIIPGNGATDIAVFGYWAALAANAAALRIVTVAA